MLEEVDGVEQQRRKPGDLTKGIARKIYFR